MELIYYILVFALGFCLGFFRGVVSGYKTKVREEDKSPYMNIRLEQHNGVFLFYDYVTGEFLTQSDEVDDGVVKLSNMFDKQFIVIRGETFNG